MGQSIGDSLSAAYKQFDVGYKSEASWSPERYAAHNHLTKAGSNTWDGVRGAFRNLTSGQASVQGFVSALFGRGTAIVTSPRQGLLVAINATRAAIESEASPEDASAIALSVPQHLGRAARRTVNHGKAFPVHTISWIVSSFIFGRLHPIAGNLAMLTGLSSGLLSDKFLIRTFMPVEPSEGAWALIEEHQPKIEQLNQQIGEARTFLNKTEMAPAAFALLALGLYVAKRLDPTASLWPLTLPAAVVASAVEGHYFSNEL